MRHGRLPRPLRLSALLATAVALALLTSCMHIPTPAKDNRPAAVRFHEKSATVTAELVGKHFVVEAKWDRHGPWRFLVDTGSSVTLVSPDFAKRYSVSPRRVTSAPVRVRTADGSDATFPSTTLTAISLGDAQFSMVPALVSSQDALSAHLGMRIDGILGFSFFRDTVFSLDYPGHKLVLRPAGDANRLPDSATAFTEELKTPRITLKLGEQSFDALVDTGSDASLMLNPSDKSVHYSIPPRQGGMIGSLVGRRPYQIGRLGESLTVGETQVANPVVILTEQLSAVGGELLRHFVVTFDPSHQRVAFSTPETAVQDTEPYRHCGLSFSKTPAYWRVETVVPGSPAEQEGIRAGDLVVRINGEPVSQWPLPRFDILVRKQPEIIFTFLQGSRETPRIVQTFDLVPLPPR